MLRGAAEQGVPGEEVGVDHQDFSVATGWGICPEMGSDTWRLTPTPHTVPRIPPSSKVAPTISTTAGQGLAQALARKGCHLEADTHTVSKSTCAAQLQSGPQRHTAHNQHRDRIDNFPNSGPEIGGT